MKFRSALLIPCLLLAPVAVHASDGKGACPSRFAKLGASGFGKWDLKNPPKLEPSQFLPPEFLSRIEKEVGPVHLHFRTIVGSDPIWRKVLLKSGDLFDEKSSGLFLELRAGDRPFMDFELIQNPVHPHQVEIHSLDLKNPLPSGNVTRLHQSQDQKGIPIDVFRYSQARLIELLKAGGFQEIQCGAEDYTVSLLYRKVSGFRPANPKSEALFRILDHLREYSRTSLPEEIRARSVDDFSRILGGASDHDSLRAELMQDALRKNSGILPPGVEPLLENGKRIGVVDRRERKAAVYFLDPTRSTPTILKWNSLIRDSKLKLRLDLQD